MKSNNLTIEFWNECIKESPKSMDLFLDFIDKYKKENNWRILFNEKKVYHRKLTNPIYTNNAQKYHDLPYAM